MLSYVYPKSRRRDMKAEDINYMEVGDEIPGSKLACEHWNWLEGLLRKVYIDAAIHFYKHGYKDGVASRKRDSKNRVFRW